MALEAELTGCVARIVIITVAETVTLHYIEKKKTMVDHGRAGSTMVDHDRLLA